MSPPPVLPYGRQDVDDADVAAVVGVLRSDFLTQGPEVAAFEAALAERCGAPHAVVVNSATSALHLACLALGVGPGDEVWTTSITFVATANAARLCGAEVRFVDIDPLTRNLCPVALRRELAAARAAGRALPRVVIAVHFAGEPCDMASIAALAREYRFRTVEDASHALGARRGAHAVGSCEHADVAVFSFHPVKIATSGEGGAALTRDAGIDARMRILRTHGVRPDARAAASGEPWRYEQRELGPNYRMSDLHAALGRSQLGRVDAFLERRHRLAERYDRALSGWPLERPRRDPGSFSALHLYPVAFVDGSRDGAVRRRVFGAMRRAGIGVNVHYIPVHTQPYYRARTGGGAVSLPHAERYYARALSLPLFGTMTFADQDRVLGALGAALGGASRDGDDGRALAA